MQNLDEKVNMELCQKLWDEYEPKIRMLCTVKLPERPFDVDDIIADTYLAFCEAIKNGKEFTNPQAWLYGTANNLIKMKYKELKLYREKQRNMSEAKFELTYEIDFLDEMITDYDIEKMKDDIENSLTENERLLIGFVKEDKLKLKDIAKIFNSTDSAIKQKYYRLSKKIKETAHDLVENFIK